MRYDKETFVFVAFTEISDELKEKTKTFTNKKYNTKNSFHIFLTPESKHVDGETELWDGLPSELWKLTNWGTFATPIGLSYDENISVQGIGAYKTAVLLSLEGQHNKPASIPISLFRYWHSKGARFMAQYASARTRGSYTGCVDARGKQIEVTRFRDYSLSAWRCTEITQPYSIGMMIEKQLSSIREQAEKTDGYLTFDDYIIAKKYLGL